VWLTALSLVLFGPELVNAQGPKKPIIIGVEYAYPGGGTAFAQLGVSAVKAYPDAGSWNEMQKYKDAPIDFATLDRFVLEYQNAGFQNLVIVLKSYSSWASKNGASNPTPKPQYLDDYMHWVRAVVLRYSGDGKHDMPGLKRPVKYFEIGSEFSSFEPESVDEYLVTLDRAYRAAHGANEKCVVVHAAFLAPGVFKDHPKPEQYPKAFAALDPKKVQNHGLEGMRRVLDRHKAFDMLNFHSMSEPREIEDTVAWLRYEMKQRDFVKPIMISDAGPNVLAGWGPATQVKGPTGMVVPPATENDRPLLAEYFRLLIDGEPATTEWTHAFAAAEITKKVVIAAEQGVALINTGFMEDLAGFKTAAAQGGSGTTAWAGMTNTLIHPRTDERAIRNMRPGYFALQQLQRHIRNYDLVERVNTGDPKFRLYRFKKGTYSVLVAWYEPGKLFLPGSPLPSARFTFKPEAASLVGEAMISASRQTTPVIEVLPRKSGGVELSLTPWPVYLYPPR
jgi:hypothetical protein